jgi:AcrR family transcriptional regulator
MAISHQRTEIRKQQIIDASREMIVKYGAEHVTIRNIARAVGISEAAIYRHFKSKTHILTCLIKIIEQNRIHEIQRAIENHSSSLDIVDIIMREHISAIEQRHGISHQVIAEIVSFGNKKLNQKCHEIVERYIDKLAELIELGIKSGELRNDINPQITALLLYGMIDGLVNIWTLSNFSFNLMERYKPMWRMFRASILSNSQTTLNN